MRMDEMTGRGSTRGATAAPGLPKVVSPASATELVVGAALGFMVVVGVHADGWAHVNVAGLETFFTPWHGLLYSSFTVLAGWVALMVVRRRRAGAPTWMAAIPLGFGPSLLGVGLFALGGVADMAWHIAFGVEAGIDALVSPTHLLLLAGGTLLLLGPARSVQRGPHAYGAARASASGAARVQKAATAGTGPVQWSRAWAGAVSVASAVTLSAFFLSYTSPFVLPGMATAVTTLPEGAPGHAAAELPAVAGLAGYVITTVILAVGMLRLRQLARLPWGAVTVMVSMVAMAGAALSSFAHVWVAVASAAGAAVAEMVTGAMAWRRTRAQIVDGGPVSELIGAGDAFTGPEPGTSRSPQAMSVRPQPWVGAPALPAKLTKTRAMALTVALVWTAHAGAVAAAGQMSWPISMWLGVVVGTAMAAGVLTSAVS